VEDMRETHHHLGNLTDFAIRYVEDLIERFAGAYPRQTEVMKLEHVDVKVVALQNIKVGHDRVNQFVGTEVRNSNRNDAPLACTEYDRLLLLRNDGTLRVVNIPDKLYVGPLKLCEKHNRDQVFSVLYRQRKKNGAYFAKRFKVDRFVTDREYKVLPEGCLIVGLYTNSGVEVRLDLKPSTRRQVEPVDLVFEEIPLRSLTARGFKVTSHPVDSISITKRGAAEEPPQPSAEPAPETDEGLEPQPEPNETPSVQPEPQSEPAAPGAPDEAPAGEATPRKKTKPGRKAEPEAEPETEPEAEPEAEPETEPETEPVPTTKKKGRGKRKADREPTSEPASESAPPTPQDAQDAQDVAVEWEKRSGKAQFHPSAKAEPKSKPTAEPTAEAEPKPKTEPSEAAFRPRKRIDEDTPFFLE
jgi:topoisomerase-4 subunit A